MKKILMKFLIFCIVLSFSITAAFAQNNKMQNNDKVTKTLLKPEKGSIVLDEVSFYEDAKGEHVSIAGTRKANGMPEGYYIQINKEKGTYKAIKEKVPESVLKE